MTIEIKEIMDMIYNEYPIEVRILEKYITILQEENKKLKKQYAKEEKKLFHDNEILQQRIDKAVEYINGFESIKAYYEYEECGYTEYNYDESFKQDLLNILRGDE